MWLELVAILTADKIIGIRLLEEESAGIDPRKLVKVKEALVKSGRGEVEKQVDLLREGNVFQRWIVALAIGDTKIESAISGLQLVLQDDSPSVRVAAAQSLLKLGNSEGIPILLRALDDTSVFLGEPPVLVSYYAQKVLVRFTGRSIRFDPTNKQSRIEGINDWETWWKANQRTFKPLQ